VQSFHALQLIDDRQSSFSSKQASDAAPRHHRHSSAAIDVLSSGDAGGGSSCGERHLSSPHLPLDGGEGATSMQEVTKKTEAIAREIVFEKRITIIYCKIFACSTIEHLATSDVHKYHAFATEEPIRLNTRRSVAR
jgi:hypothetical protein